MARTAVGAENVTLTGPDGGAPSTGAEVAEAVTDEADVVERTDVAERGADVVAGMESADQAT